MQSSHAPLVIHTMVPGLRGRFLLAASKMARYDCALSSSDMPAKSANDTGAPMVAAMRGQSGAGPGSIGRKLPGVGNRFLNAIEARERFEANLIFEDEVRGMRVLVEVVEDVLHLVGPEAAHA